MRISDVFGGTFLRASDLASRAPLTVRIASVGLEAFGDDGQAKPCVAFHGARRRLVLNRSNSEILVGAYGDDTDAWINKPVTLSVEKTLFRGALVDSIKVRIPATAAAPEAAVLPRPSPSRPRPAPPIEEPLAAPDPEGGNTCGAEEEIPF